MKLPVGVRVVRQTREGDRLDVVLEVATAAYRAAVPLPCSGCGFEYSMHVLPFGGLACPPVLGRERGEGVYVDRDL